MSGIYVLLDPFNRPTSGITTYTKIAAKRLNAMGFRTCVIAKQISESLLAFKQRVAQEINTIGTGIKCVEAPETLAVSSYLPDAVPLHIRLHCSRSLGAAIQGLPYDQDAVAYEQKEITRAKWVSAPSRTTVAVSQMLFNLPKTVAIYPNPSPLFTGNNSILPDFDVLFLGRWQQMKGKDYLIEIARRLPSRTFVIASEKDINERLPKNVCFIRIMGHEAKIKILSRCRAVVIPSLFETFSMVGLEALAAGRPVVTWKHIGISEYTSPPYVFPVNYCNLDEITDVLNKIISQTIPDGFEICVRQINNRFDEAIKSLTVGHPSAASYTQSIYDAELKETLSVLMEEKMGKLKSYIFARKLRKLWRDPAAFWRDSKLRRLFVAPGEAYNKTVPEIKPITPELPLTKKLFAQIKPAGKIEFNDPHEKPVGMVTALLYNQNAPYDFIQQLLNGFDAFLDFPYVKRDRLQLGTFDLNSEAKTLTLLNRIDLNNKRRLSKISNMILLDAPAVLCRVLRSCGTNQRLILILTSKYFTELPEPEYIDALIIVGNDHPAAGMNGLRRKVIVKEFGHLPLAIRRIIQENAPKNPDMLLPLINDFVYRGDEYLNFNPSRYQGIIRLKQQSVPIAANLHELCVKTANNIESMAVLESIYMRYRSLCEDIERGASPAKLIEYCLYDGVLFNVRFV